MSSPSTSTDQAEATKEPPVKASESETSIQIQMMETEAAPQPLPAAPEDPAPSTAEETEPQTEPPADAGAAAAQETPVEQGPTEPEPEPESEQPASDAAAASPQDAPAATKTPDAAAAAATKVPDAAAASATKTADAAAPNTPAGDASSTKTPAADAASKTPASAATDSTGKPRTTRSRNPAFAAKQKSFIKDFKRSVAGAQVADEKRVAGGGGGGGDEGKKKRKSEESAAAAGGSGVAPNDNCCWVCHREGKVVCCETCPRVFHLRCAHLSTDPPGDWVCVECRRVVQAETVDNLSPAMKMLTHEQFTLLLKHAIGRLKGLPGAEPFITPVDEKKFPNYGEFVACPMDLNTMEENINRGQYGSTEAFIADCKWILHNCILFNGQTSKLTALAKSLLRMCKWEMEEIETCPDCYSNAYLSEDWFTLACPHPHMLIWARLKGFPYWPAKAVKSRDGNVDCRFFGRHDRAWVPIKECYLFSKEPPSPPKNRSKSLDACIEELEEHIHNLEEKFGKFVHAKPRTIYDPRKIAQHIKQMLPNYECNVVRPDQEVPKRKRAGSELQLDKLEKLRQQKKARRSGSQPPQPGESVGAAGGAAGEVQLGPPEDQPGVGAPGGPPQLQAQVEDEEMEPDEEEMAEELDEEMMEEVEDEEAVDEPPPPAAKPSRKPVGLVKTPVAPAAAAASPAVKPTAATPAKPAAAVKTTNPPTPTAKAAQNPATTAAAQPTNPAAPAPATPATKPAVKAVAQKQTPVSAGKPAKKGAVVAALGQAIPVQSPAAAQRLVKMAAAASPAGGGGTQRPTMVIRQSQTRPKLSPVQVRANGVGSMSPAARPRLQQQQPRGATQSQLAAARPGVAPGPDPAFVVSIPSRVGPMMIVPSSSGGGGAAGGPGAPAGPPEGATAAEAPPPPVHTGAVSEQLRTQANDLSELIRSGLEQVLSDLAQGGAPPAALASLRLQLDRLQWRHQMELSEQKKVTDTMLAELRNSMEIEQKKTVNKLTAAFASERGDWSRLTELKVAETKKKQWCATCGREAIFYCCWNTSYCDFPCQEAQWPKHMLTCANQQSSGQPMDAGDQQQEQQQQLELQQDQQQVQQLEQPHQQEQQLMMMPQEHVQAS